MAETNLLSRPLSLADLNTENYACLGDAFRAACRRYSSEKAFHGVGATVTFAELDKHSRNFAAWLLDEGGLEYGDRIAIQMPNLVQYPIVAWAALRAGLVIVNTNPMYTAPELVHQFNDSGAKALVVLADLLPLIERVVPQTGIKTVIATSATDLTSPAALPESDLPDLRAFSEVLSAGEEIDLPVVISSMDDIAVLQYTGGTTGLPKGAILTHGNVYAAARTSTLAFNRKSTEAEISIAPMPVYHIYGFSVNVVSTVIHGRLSIMIPNPRDIGGLIAEMKRWPFNGFAGVNTLFAAMLQHPEFDEIDFSHLDTVVSGGAALVEDIANEWERRTKTCIYEGWGMSETCAAGTVNAHGDAHLGTVGKPMPGFEMKVVNEEGESLPAGEEGELKVCGPQVMKGYWGRADATAEALDADGWLSTGDVAVIEGDGFIRIVDRIKDMILVSGFNVYPNEVEAVVQAHPDVFECAVVGIPDPRCGEAVKLYAVATSAGLNADALKDWCRERLTNYKIPRDIELCAELPKSSVGKILRRELRDQATLQSK